MTRYKFYPEDDISPWEHYRRVIGKSHIVDEYQEGNYFICEFDKTSQITQELKNTFLIEKEYGEVILDYEYAGDFSISGVDILLKNGWESFFYKEVKSQGYYEIFKDDDDFIRFWMIEDGYLSDAIPLDKIDDWLSEDMGFAREEDFKKTIEWMINKTLHSEGE